MPKCGEAPFYPDRVTIEEDGSAAGERVSFSSNVVTGWPCRINSISGDETWRGRTLEGSVSYVLEGPYIDGVTDKMRLSVTSGRGMFDGLSLNIKAARPRQAKGRQRQLEVYCVENTG